ncbi:hypothetical protein [Proteiniborus sp. MB09-C3]|uniref:hypothetical protein n=1 Tax=Proteiniborus sp. MB09-C3 TaxID=3050072 RepID=UPI002557C6A1|nr:hypothetical protein [Proteiniborus sp. MB09-C3]WIV13189.1 hypothetical protein QO263_05630 [Proteiniborus sp. MB09-C3]
MTNSIITLMVLFFIMIFVGYLAIMFYSLTAKLRRSCYSIEDDSYNYRRHMKMYYNY